jgi:hypothetical protein
VGAVFGLLAAGGSQTSDALARAGVLSSRAPGYRMHMSMTMSYPGVSAPITASGDAVVDQRDHATSMTFLMDFSQIPQVAQQLGSSTVPMSMVLDGSTFYMRLPQGILPEASASKPWIEMNFAKVTGIKNLWSLGSSPAMSNPGQMFQYLRAESSSVTDEGHEQVDGVMTTHYEAQVSLNQLPPGVPEADRQALLQMASKLEQATGTDSIPMEVWIDRRGLVRRMVMTLRLPVGGAVISETVTADITDYGPQPRPAVPPADQVQDLTSLVTSSING